MTDTSKDPASGARELDDRLDALVSEFSDRLRGGDVPARASFLERVPAHARPGLERVLKMIEAGMAQTPSAADPLAPGLQLDQYRLDHEIGRGGMARVWLAHDTDLQRPVAIKLLRPGLALEQRNVERFRREALAIASLVHPHIVQIHGVGETRGHHWLVMEYVEGPSLATVLDALPDDRPRTAEDLARAAGIPELVAVGRDYEQALAMLLAPVAEALAAAHDHGLIHRDVKPSNILLHRDGRAVIADFGLAKGDQDPALSLTGEGIGTPYYMSPEQAHLSSKSVDARSDVYSMGVTLFEALSGRRPFAGSSFLEVVEAIRTTVPPSIRSIAHERSKGAAAVVRRAMAREPEHRYRDARALHADLVALAEGTPTAALREEGGPLRRALATLRMARAGHAVEYRSGTTFLGLPLVHYFAGRRMPGQRRRVAKGWIAIGDVAYGGLAMGEIAFGGIAVGAIAGGVLSWGALAAGLACTGGIAVGGVTFAGVGLGWLAIGGVAAGFAGIGGLSYGHYATGGSPHGTYVIGAGRRDPEAVAFFEEMFGSVSGFISALFGG